MVLKSLLPQLTHLRYNNYVWFRGSLCRSTHFALESQMTPHLKHKLTQHKHSLCSSKSNASLHLKHQQAQTDTTQTLTLTNNSQSTLELRFVPIHSYQTHHLLQGLEKSTKIRVLSSETLQDHVHALVVLLASLRGERGLCQSCQCAGDQGCL